MKPLFRNALFVAQKNLSIKKYEDLNELNNLNNVEANEHYRNNVSGKEIITFISESIRK